MRSLYPQLILAICVLFSCATENNRELPTELPFGYSKGFELVTLNGCECMRLYDLESANRVVKATYCHCDPQIADLDYTRLPNPLQSPPRIATVSTTHVSLFAAVDQLNTVVGTAFADRIFNVDARQRINDGKIVDLSGEKDIDTEKTIAAEPTILITYPYGNNQYERLKDSDIIIVPFSEYLETHPLGRAEWIVAAGFLTGQVAEATARFEEIKSRYLTLDESTKDLPKSNQPIVFTGSHANGTWYAPSGNSFMSVFTADAGAQYLFNDRHESGNISLDFEELIVRAMSADYWGKVIYTPGELTLADLRADDARYTELPAFQKGQVFYCNAAETDYFGDAIVQPDVVLADLIKIFHPELLPGHEARYFRMVAQ